MKAKILVCKTLFITIFVFISTALFPQKTVNTYFIGNSLTDCIEYSDLQEMVESQGHSMPWGRHMIPGAPLEWIWGHPSDGFSEDPYGYYTNALPNYNWDALSLQPYDRKLSSDSEYSIKFIDLADHYPELQVYIYMRWPGTDDNFPKTADGWNDLWTRPYTGGWDGTNETRDYLEILVDKLRDTLPHIKPVLLIPMGEVMYALNNKMKNGEIPGFSSIWDFYADGSHLTDVGRYMCAVTGYATLFKEDPRGLPVPGGFGTIGDNIKNHIQTTVWEVVTSYAYAGVNEQLVEVISISVSPQSLSLTVQEEFTLSTQIEPSNASNKKIEWSSIDPAIASVNQEGIITGLKSGTTFIVANTVDGGFKDSCEVTVTGTAIPVTSISVTPKTLKTTAGELIDTLEAAISPPEATNKQFQWLSNNTDVASVNNDGIISAANAGIANIIAESVDGNHRDTCVVTVIANQPPVALISASPMSGNAPLTVSFDGTNSFDPDNGDFVLGYDWFFGDESQMETSNSPMHTYNSPGVYTVKLVAMDNHGLRGDTAYMNITVTGPGNVSIHKLPNGQSIIIDGNPESIWSNIQKHKIEIVNLGSVDNDNDLSGSWKALWDNENLYYLIEVIDDQESIDNNTPWSDDAIELYIDGDNSKNTSYDNNDYQLAFLRNDQTTIETGTNSAQNTTGIDHAFTNGTNSYTLEVSIPWSLFGVNPVTGYATGTDIHIVDDDNGDERDAKIAWADHDEIAWKNPSVFGTIYLEGIVTSAFDLNTIDIYIAPNPATDNILVSANDVISNLTITDMTGKQKECVKPGKYKTSINISNLPKGLFIMQVRIKGQGLFMKKFIKK